MDARVDIEDVYISEVDPRYLAVLDQNFTHYSRDVSVTQHSIWIEFAQWRVYSCKIQQAENYIFYH